MKPNPTTYDITPRPKQFTFWVRQMPGTNDLIEAAKISPFVYRALKKKWTEIVAGKIRIANHTHERRGAALPKFTRIDILCEWVEPDRRRDPDNVHGGIKFICDGIEKAGLIPRDSQRHVANIKHKEIQINRKNSGVRVTVIEVGDK